jgi:hypothetical protein
MTARSHWAPVFDRLVSLRCFSSLGRGRVKQEHKDASTVRLTFVSNIAAAWQVCDAHHKQERQLYQVRVVENGKIIRW